MTSREFTESLAFERLEPDPAEVTMHLLAALVTMTANVNRDTKRMPTPYTVDDFLPDPYAPTKAERQAKFDRIMAAYARARKERQH